jgi:hypothetical protein
MKRWLGWLFCAVGLVFLLCIPHRPVSPPSYPPVAGDPSVLSPNEFVFTWCRVLRAASPAFPRNRAGPLEFFATHSAFLITDDNGPPWLDHRGPPGPNACSQDLVTSCKGAGQAGSLRRALSNKIPGEFKIRGFATRFS